MASRRTTQITLHGDGDEVQVVVHEWPDEAGEMIGPVIYGRRKYAHRYDVEILVPASDPDRFEFDPFDAAVHHAASFAVQAMQGDPVERRRRAAAGGGPPGGLTPA